MNLVNADRPVSYEDEEYLHHTHRYDMSEKSRLIGCRNGTQRIFATYSLMRINARNLLDLGSCD